MGSRVPVVTGDAAPGASAPLSREQMVTGFGVTIDGVPARGAGAAAGLVPRTTVATAVPAPVPGRPQASVRLAVAVGARMGPTQVPPRIGSRPRSSAGATPVTEGRVAEGREPRRGRLKDVAEGSPAEIAEAPVMVTAVAATVAVVAEAVREPRDTDHAVAQTNEVGPVGAPPS